jgi:acyl dehydratase
MMWFEDIVIGARSEIGTYTFTEEEIIAFARKYDPQPYHIDKEAAARSHFGGLIASGWHTAATWMKLVIRHRDNTRGPQTQTVRSGVSPGFRELKWLKPVRPGMTLRFSTMVAEKIELRSRPEWGLIRSRNEAIDETGELVMSFIGQGLVARRPKDGATGS